METKLWIILSVLIVLFGVALLALVMQRKNKRPPDYYNFFIMGLIWTAIGIPMKNYALGSMGLVFLIAGLVNKKKWKKNRVRWTDLSKKEKKFKMIMVVLLSLLVFVGLVVFFL